MFMADKLGILGLGSKATKFYIEELNRQSKAVFGKDNTCPLEVLYTDFDEINALLPHYSKQLDYILNKYLEKIINNEIGTVLIPNITLHETVDKIIERSNLEVSIIHPLNETVKHLKENNVKEATLLGSYYTMRAKYISSFFGQRGIYLRPPSTEDMQKVDNIRKLIYNEDFTDDPKDQFLKLLDKYLSKDNIIVACTELSIINSKRDQRIFDMARIQIGEAVKQLKIMNYDI